MKELVNYKEIKNMILTKRGNIPLEELTTNDQVLGKNITTGKYEFYQVTEIGTFEKASKYWVIVNEEYKFAAHQTLFVNDNFSHARQLKEGDQLETLDGKRIIVSTVRKERDRSPKIKIKVEAIKSFWDKVFKREKRGSHTYFIDGILVHNASRYWVGNGGDWAGTTHWSASSGGANGASEPTSSDDANFDSNSFSSTGQTVTNNSSANCAAWNWTGVTNSPVFSLNNYLFTHGAITLTTGMTTTQSGGWFLQVFGAGSYNINFAGVVLNFNVTFNDVGTYTLTGWLNCPSSSFRVLLQKGTLNLNGQPVTAHQFSCDGSTNTRTLNMGSSNVTVDTFDFSSTTGLTFNCGTSSLIVNTSLVLNGLTYYSVTFNYAVATFPSGYDFSSANATTLIFANNCYRLTVGTVTNVTFKKGSVGLTSGTITNLTLSGNASFDANAGTVTNVTMYEGTTFSVAGSYTNFTITKNAGVYQPTQINANITVTGTFTASGLSQVDRCFVAGGLNFGDSNRGASTKYTITAAAVSISNVDFQNITGAGAGTWSGTSIGNGANNSGITFTTPVTRYWVGDGGDWNDTTHWSSSTGGATGATMPLPQDTVLMDANSFSIASQTVNIKATIIPAIDTNGVAHTPSLSFRTTVDATYVVGSTFRISGATPVGNQALIYLTPDGNMTFYSGGNTIPWGIYVAAVGGTVLFGDNCTFDTTNGFMEIVSGGFNMNGFNLTTPAVYANWSAVCTITLGAGTVTITGSNGQLDFSNSQNSVSAALSIITFSGTGGCFFNAYGFTFHNVNFSCEGTIQIDGRSSVTSTFDDVAFTGNAQTIKFQASCTFNFSSLTMGSSAGQVYTLESTTSGTAATLIARTGYLQFDYLTVQDIAGISGDPPQQDTGWKTPTASGFDDEGSTQNWSNTNNIFASDDTYASVVMTVALSQNWSDEILGSGFDFSALPDNATILGMEMTAEVHIDNATDVMHVWPYVEKDATVGGNFAEAGSVGYINPTTSDVVYSWGGPTDIWDSTLTVADIKASKFGVGMDMISQGTLAADRTVSLDQFRLKIYYKVYPDLIYWYMGSHSTNVSGNSGLLFADLHTKTFTVDGYITSLSEKLIDNFDSGLDSSKWNEVISTGSISFVNGQVKINGSTSSGYNALESVIPWDMRSSYAMVHLIDAGDQSITSHDAILYVSIFGDANNKLYWVVEHGTIYAVKIVGGVQTTITSAVYNSSTHKWLRIRESGGTCYFDYSADSENWTNFASLANPFSINSMAAAIQQGTWQNEASASFATFDSFNIFQSSPTFTVDGIIFGTNTKTFTVDGIIFGTNIITFTVDGEIETTGNTDTFTVDGVVVGFSATFNRRIGFFLNNALLKTPISITSEFVFTKTDMTMFTGRSVRDIAGIKKKWVLMFQNLTKDQVDMLRTIVDAKAPVPFNVDSKDTLLIDTTVFAQLNNVVYDVVGSDYRASAELDLLEQFAS